MHAPHTEREPAPSVTAHTGMPVCVIGESRQEREAHITLPLASYCELYRNEESRLLIGGDSITENECLYAMLCYNMINAYYAFDIRIKTLKKN